MKPLEENLNALGYQCFLPDLPLTYKEFEYSAVILEDILEEIVNNNLLQDEKIHLVGHSTGGLVVRKLIAETDYINRINRCVLIATPNKGSGLANLAGKIKPFVEIFKTLKSLRYDYIERENLTNCSSIEIGAIAGNRNNRLVEKLIGDKNDGMVEVGSVYYSELTDFIVLPYGHRVIHHQKETAKWVDVFLRRGEFSL